MSIQRDVYLQLYRDDVESSLARLPPFYPKATVLAVSMRNIVAVKSPPAISFYVRNLHSTCGLRALSRASMHRNHPARDRLISDSRRALQFRGDSRPHSLLITRGDIISRHCAILSRSYRIKSSPCAVLSRR